MIALALQTVTDDAPALAPIELAALCRRAEHAAVGVPSGIMDQAASILGRADHGVLLDCGTLRHEHVPLPVDHDLLVVDSGVRRTLEGSGYRARTEELQASLGVLGGRRPADVEVDDLPELLRGLDEIPARRLRHVITENARARLVVDALAQGDLSVVGQLFDAGHVSLRDDFEVSIPELDALVELARDAGATAARMTGGGFGGAIIVLARAEDAEDIAVQLTDRYRGRFPGREPAALRCRAADGARRID